MRVVAARAGACHHRVMLGEAYDRVREAITKAEALPPLEAHALLSRAFEVAVDAPVDETTLANLLRHLADASVRAGRGVEAEAHLRDAVARFTRAVGPDDYRTTSTYGTIADVRRACGDVRGALAIARETLHVHGSPSALHYVAIARDHDTLGERTEADLARDEALRIAHEELVDPMTRASSAIMVATHLAGRDRGVDAERLLEATRDALADPARVSRSISARVPAHVRAEVDRALAAVRAATPFRLGEGPP